MESVLHECRWLYNALLENKQRMYEDFGESVSLYELHDLTVALKDQRQSLAKVHAQVLQNVGVRIDLAFKAFFRRCKAGEEPGYPRFRGAGSYDSFTYPQAPSGCSLSGDILTLSKIGKVKVILHRPIQGKVKTVCIRRSSTGKWFATFSCEVEDEFLPVSTEAVGIDVGLTSFATFSDGTSIENPRFFRKGEKSLAAAQRKLSKTPKGTPERKKRKKVVSRLHERIANQRKNFVHQESRKIVNRYGIIVVEDIHASRMVHNHCLSKSIYDAAWTGFFFCLTYKAENAGRIERKENPAYTTQDCSGCGHRQIMPLSERIYRCPCCGMVKNRDWNAALNILARGLASIGNQSLEAPGFSRGV